MKLIYCTFIILIIIATSITIMIIIMFPLLKKVESLYFALQLPCGFDHFYGGGGMGNPPCPQRGAGRPSLLPIILDVKEKEIIRKRI